MVKYLSKLFVFYKLPALSAICIIYNLQHCQNGLYCLVTKCNTNWYDFIWTTSLSCTLRYLKFAWLLTCANCINDAMYHLWKCPTMPKMHVFGVFVLRGTYQDYPPMCTLNSKLLCDAISKCWGEHYRQGHPPPCNSALPILTLHSYKQLLLHWLLTPHLVLTVILFHYITGHPPS